MGCGDISKHQAETPCQDSALKSHAFQSAQLNLVVEPGYCFGSHIHLQAPLTSNFPMNVRIFFAWSESDLKRFIGTAVCKAGELNKWEVI
jgi:hypothetical protein